MLAAEFPVISSGNLYTAIDTYASTISTQPPTNSPSWPNGALNNLGATFLLPQGASEGPTIYYPGGSLNSKGWGAPLVVRYVRYLSTANPDILTAPAAIYWTDETYTTITGVFSEGLPAATGNLNSLAGVLLINTTNYPGSKTGAQLATILNGNYCFIVTRGFIPGVNAPAATAIGDALVGTAGNFTLGRVASGTAPTSRYNLIAQSAVAANVSDVLVNTDLTL